MEHYYKIDRSSSLEHGIRDLFRVNRKKKKGSSYREKSKTGDETGVWTNAHGKQREAAGPAWKKKDNDDETRESGKKGNKSKYEGGFITKNGRSNNSPAYNHDYYMKNKDKWYDRVPENPTESDVKRARMNANSSISAANKMFNTLIKDADKETVKRLGWDKWTADQIGGAVNRSLESMVTASRYKRQNSLGQKAKDAAEDVKKKVTRGTNNLRNNLVGTVEKVTNLTTGRTLERRNGGEIKETTSNRRSNSNQSSNSSDKKRSGNVSWEFGTPELTTSDKKKNTSSSSDKYVTYKNKNMEAGTLYKDKDGNIWKKLGGPGTNNWMKVN